MAGVKGRSGRKSNLEEVTVSQVVNGSMRLIRQYIEDKTIPLERKVEVASRFALKKIPDRVEQALSVLNISEATINKLLDFMQNQQNRAQNMQIPHIQSDNTVIDVEIIEPNSNNNNELQKDADV